MKFISELNAPYNLTKIDQPLGVTHKWVFNAQQEDFFLTPITYLGETYGPALKLEINGEQITLPLLWGILVVDTTTYQVDSIPVSSCANAEYHAYLFSPTDSKLNTAKINVVDFVPNIAIVHPEIEKYSGVCVPTGKRKTVTKDNHVSIIATPYDLYKFLKDKLVGDFM